LIVEDLAGIVPEDELPVEVQNSSVSSSDEHDASDSDNVEPDWIISLQTNNASHIKQRTRIGDLVRHVNPEKYYEFADVEIGSGGSGTVYMAKEITSGNSVAIKLIDLIVHMDNRPNTAEELDAIATELQMLEFLKNEVEICPNIANYYGAYEHENRLYIAMELMSGNLYDVSHGYMDHDIPIPEDLIAYIAGQILTGLQYLHKRNIIHRDIKPENVMWNATGAVKIIDFGLAKNNSKTKGLANSTGKGSLAYMNKQRFDTQWGPYGVETDLWALGVMVYEMAEGQDAYDFLSNTNYMEKLLLEVVRSDGLTVSDEKNRSQQLLDFIDICFNKNQDIHPSAENLLRSEFVIHSTLTPLEMSVIFTYTEHQRRYRNYLTANYSHSDDNE